MTGQLFPSEEDHWVACCAAWQVASPLRCEEHIDTLHKRVRGFQLVLHVITEVVLYILFPLVLLANDFNHESNNAAAGPFNISLFLPSNLLSSSSMISFNGFVFSTHSIMPTFVVIGTTWYVLIRSLRLQQAGSAASISFITENSCCTR